MLKGLLHLLAVSSLVAASGCGSGKVSSLAAASDGRASTAANGRGAIESLIPADRLAAIKASLPKVGDAKMQAVLASEQTLWYDADVMTPSYQDSLGASSNSHWPDLVAASEDIISGLHDRANHRWQFPFATTAGTDHSTNLRVENFLWLPQVEGHVLSIPIWQVRRNYNRPEWMWVYPNTAVVGEVLFIVDGANLLPSEIRTRTRGPQGWATNVYRPFPTAKSLSAAIKASRADWDSRPNLKTLVTFLEDGATLTPKTLAAKAALAPTFEQDGWLDVLPDFGDAALVRQLLTTTSFKSAYDTAWKQSAGKVAFAASTSSSLSIVPDHYEAGVLEVTDEACMRCHKEGGRLVSEFYDALYLYGELWGKDGIFSFHPYDESLYPQLRAQDENRRINPRLRQMGVFEEYDAQKHIPPLYPPLGPIPPTDERS